MVDVSHGLVCVSFGSNNTYTRRKTQQAPMKLKLAVSAAGVRSKKMCVLRKKKKACMQSDVAGDVSYEGDWSIAPP